MELTEGTRIYYTGDMANNESFGHIIKSWHDKWGSWVDIHLDDGRILNMIGHHVFSEEYLGYGGTRFVTETAYYVHRDKQLQALYKSIGVK